MQLWSTLLVLLVLLFLVQYMRGYISKRVIAWGKDTYIRFFPNPGAGIRVGDKCLMLSFHRGLEMLKKSESGAWYREWAVLSRVK